MKRFVNPVLFILILLLAACAPAQASTNPANPQPASVSAASASPAGNEAGNSADLARSDQQGAVTVTVAPLNLDHPSEQLEFDVALETHSVDLSMDLAILATLTTDTGVTVPATLWDAPRGGHHVAGKLIFPAMKDGQSILAGASTLTLTLVNVDVPSRSFEWDLK